MTTHPSDGPEGRVRRVLPWRSEFAAMARLAAPLGLAHAAVILMSVVDTFFVGRFDATHLAGVGVGNALSHGLLVFGMGAALTLEPLIAQALGAGEPLRAVAWWRTGARLNLLLGLPLSLAALLLAWQATLFDVSEAIAAEAFSYTLWRTPGNLVFLYWLAARSVIQSQQRVQPLLWAALLANVANAAIDAALVDGIVTLGAAGAGLATSISSLVLLVVARHAVRLSQPREIGELPAAPMRRLFVLGLPVSLQLAAEFLVFSTAGVLAARIDAASGAAHQIALNCATLTFMFANGVGGAAGARIGEAVGLGDTDLARRRAGVAVLLGLAVMGASALMFALWSGPIAAVFTADHETTVQAVAATLLLIAAFFQLFDGTQVILGGILRGAGDIRVPFVVTLLAYWAVGFAVGVALAFEAELGVEGLWYGLSAGLATASIGLGLRAVVVFRRDIARLR
jgi:MATE family multidrug resistance protein